MILSIIFLILVFAISLLSRTAALILFIISLIIPIRYWIINGFTLQTIIIIVLYLITAVFLIWNIYQLHKKDSNVSYDNRPYEEINAGSREVKLPFTIQSQNVDRLVLINFLEGEDLYYNGFEPQRVFNGQEYYYRVLAYRNDGYTDFYTDANIDAVDVNMSVAGQGINEVINTNFTQALIEVDEKGKLNTIFNFTDIYGRDISIKLAESPKTTNSVKVDFLAPIGSGSAHPEYFPYFIMNNFDFMQTRSAINEIYIDEKKIEVEGFPVPLPVQSEMRNFVRYTMDAEIIELFPVNQTHVISLETVENKNYAEIDSVKYLFDQESLSKIQFANHELVFEPALNFEETGEGVFSIIAYPERLELHGTYTVAVEEEESKIGLVFAKVVPVQHKDIYERLIFNNIAVFNEWPLHYTYESEIDLETGQISATWTNLNLVK